MSTGDQLLIDPAALYWARLRVPAGERREEALRYAFEPSLPVPIDDVEARFVVDTSQDVIACAIEHAELRRLIEAHPGPVESIRPSAAPPWLEHADDVLDRLEFRDRGYASPRAVRMRRRSAQVIAVGLLIVSAIGFFGIEARRGAIAKEIASVDAAAVRTARAALGAQRTDASGVDPVLLLTAERRRLALTRSEDRGVTRPEDIGRVYTDLLARWPDDIPTRVDTLDLRASRISIRGGLRDARDFDALRASLLARDDSWRDDASDLSRAQRGFDFSIALERHNEEATR